MISLNDQGLEVRVIQLLLNSFLKPSPNLRVDGEFGPATQKALKSLQFSNGSLPDGNVDSKTLLSLGIAGFSRRIPTICTHQAPWMDLAFAELGVHEYSLPGRHNPRIVEYHQSTSLKATDDETAWCSSFVNWVMVNSGKKGTNNALAKSWLEWGCPVNSPYRGVVTVIKMKTSGNTAATGSRSGYHVGFFIFRTSSHIRLLGGNQYHRVKESDFPLSKYEIKGYRRPI